MLVTDDLYEKVFCMLDEVDRSANSGILGNSRSSLIEVKAIVKDLRMTLNEGFIIDPRPAA